MKKLIIVIILYILGVIFVGILLIFATNKETQYPDLKDKVFIEDINKKANV